MKHIIIITAALVLGASSAWAQQPPPQATDHGAHHPSPAAATAQAGDFAEGEVRRVDKAGGKITLRHGEIKSLDMPPMTMVFVVADAAMLDKVKVGDKVRFRATNRDGRMIVVEIQTAN